MEKEKGMMRGQNASAFVEYLKTSGFPYTLKISNYTTEIISEAYNMQFLQSMRGKQCFAAYAKVKANVRKFPIPSVDKDSLRYFSHNFKKDIMYEAVINIDLKSAYATVLYNKGFITEDTFKYLSRIPKLDRLASVGMLAGKKYIFSYDENNKLIHYEKTVSQYEGFFYYCVQETEKIMNEIQLICGEDYLFTWVDGVYMKADTANLLEVENYLNTLNFPYTLEPLQNFSVKINNGKVSLTFDKFNKKLNAYKKKFFNIPATPSMLAVDLVQLLTDKNLKNEVLSIKSFSGEARKVDSVPLHVPYSDSNELDGGRNVF